MKKRFLLTLMTVMLTCTVGAQVKPIVLGDKHAMLKMEAICCCLYRKRKTSQPLPC